MNDILDYFWLFIKIILFIIAARAIVPMLGDRLLQHGHQLTPYEGFSFSPTLFYTMVKKAIEKRGLTMKFLIVSYFEDSFVSQRREYLRIEFDEYVYLICAAPLGTGYFVSWRQFTRLTLSQIFIKNLPFLRNIHFKKTYFQEDMEMMFRSAVNSGLSEAMNEMVTTKGLLGKEFISQENGEKSVLNASESLT